MSANPASLIHLAPPQLERDLAIRDLSDPEEGPHALQLVVDRAVTALAAAWGCKVRWCRGPRVVDVETNYDRLGYGGDAVSREARYSRYVDDRRMLRSHSSALVPPALDALAANPADDVLLVCPGIAFRRDAIDWQHTGTPHQLDLWRIRRSPDGRPLGGHDMDEMTSLLLAALVPGAPWRVEPRVHPYTLNGRQVDVQLPAGGGAGAESDGGGAAMSPGRPSRTGNAHAGDWVEVWECGLAHPEVLAGAGLPAADGWSGLALGMGLDRFLMLAKGIPDIRLLRSSDRRVASQMLDLEPYRPVSSMPAVRRDLSIAVPEDDDDETLGDRVRDALDDDAVRVEEVAVLSATSYSDLPAAARERLGATVGQKNVLVRLVLRDLDRTLTDREANVLRDRVYAALHRGSEHQWAAVGGAGRRLVESQEDLLRCDL